MSDINTPSEPFLSLTPAVFQILLALLDDEQHDYRIMQLVENNSGGKFKMGPGTLYGTIKRMLADGFIEETEERPDPSMDDQRRRYYRLTAAGKNAARAEAERLAVLVASARAKNLLPLTDNETI